MESKRYIVRLRDGSERVVVAKSYRFENEHQAYLFVGNDNAEDQFVAFSSVEWILLEERSSGPPAHERFELIHKEIHREHGLISNRMSWYVTSQSFLVAAFAVGGNYNYRFQWMSRFIPVLGIAITLLIGLSILAGVGAMMRLRKQEFAISNVFEDAPIYLHWLGMAAPCLIPVILLSAWITALVLGP
jgi:hypothetical protein